MENDPQMLNERKKILFGLRGSKYSFSEVKEFAAGYNVIYGDFATTFTFQFKYVEVRVHLKTSIYTSSDIGEGARGKAIEVRRDIYDGFMKCLEAFIDENQDAFSDVGSTFVWGQRNETFIIISLRDLYERFLLENMRNFKKIKHLEKIVFSQPRIDIKSEPQIFKFE